VYSFLIGEKKENYHFTYGPRDHARKHITDYFMPLHHLEWHLTSWNEQYQWGVNLNQQNKYHIGPIKVRTIQATSRKLNVAWSPVLLNKPIKYINLDFEVEHLTKELNKDKKEK
jgi:hypothetical protein